jgi:uncharacterized protein Yka (UPF0111/DUF47 family)
MSGLERARELATAAVPWGILGLMGMNLLGGHVSESIERLIQQNGAVLLLVAIVIQYAPRAIDAQRQQAVAMSSMAEAVNRVSAQRDELGQEVLRTLTKLEINDVAILRELDVIRRSGYARVPGEGGAGGRDT